MPSTTPTVARVATNLRNLRRDAGLTQGELAAKAKLGRSTIALLESGEAVSVRTDTLDSIAKVLGEPVSKLVGGGESRQVQAAKAAKRTASK